MSDDRPMSGPNSTIPATRIMIKENTLAHYIITRHSVEDNVFDRRSLGLLKQFCADPSQKDALLQDRGYVDEQGVRPGTKAAGKGDLVGYIIARHGTDDATIRDGEFERLQDWFKEGGDGEKMASER